MRIEDPKAVGRVLREDLAKTTLLETDGERLIGWLPSGDGSKSALLTEVAEERFGLSYSVFHRLASGTAIGTTWATCFALEKRLTATKGDRPVWDRLRPVLLAPPVWEIIDDYASAIQRSIEHYGALCSAEPGFREFTSEEKSAYESVRQLVRRLGLPATRDFLAKWRVLAPIYSWGPLTTERLRDAEILFKAGFRFEKALIREEAALLWHRLRRLGRQAKSAPGVPLPR